MADELIVNAPAEGSAGDVDAPMTDIPEHLQGKSQQDMVDMYRSLEKKLGAQSEELGSLRKLADTAILNNQQPASSSADAEVDFYSDPEQAVARIIEAKLQPFNKVLSQQREQATVQKLDAEHSGWKKTVESVPFQEWVAESPVRTKLFMEANQADYTAAHELLSTWKGLGRSKSETETASKKAVDRDRKLRSLATEKGAAGIDSRKILQASDLRQLKMTNPSRYSELLPDIRKAYAEGRVKR